MAAVRLAALAAALCLGALGCGEPDAPQPRQTEDLRVDEEEAARLRALGYAGVAEEVAEPEELGVTRLDAERVQPGLNYFTNAQGCSSQLATLDGRVLQTWSQEPCSRWGNSVLLESGGVLAVHQRDREHRNPREPETFQPAAQQRDLLRLDREGKLVWSAAAPVHHDVELTPSGRIATLTYAHRLDPKLHPTVPVKDHAVALFDLEGGLVEEHSILELLRTAPKPFRLKAIEPSWSRLDGLDEVDLIHANSVEWVRRPELAGRGALYAPSNVLLSLRHQDVVIMVDWERKRVVWSWGQDELSGPHDATLLANGNVLVFDNGLGRGWSRVLEVDPLSREIVWEYRAPEGEDFFTPTRGASQRLPNGNTLITESDRGRAFEVTHEGEIVWEFLNPNVDEEGKPIVLVRVRRLPDPPSPRGPFAWSD